MHFRCVMLVPRLHKLPCVAANPEVCHDRHVNQAHMEEREERVSLALATQPRDQSEHRVQVRFVTVLAHSDSFFK